MGSKKIIFFLIFLGLFVFSLNSSADWTKMETNWPPSPAGMSLSTSSTLTNLIQYAYEWVFALAGLAFFISLIYAGIQYLSSMGDPAKTKSAMDRIKNAFIGIILLLSSWLILNTINPDLTSFKITVPDFGQMGGIGTTTNNIFGEAVSYKKVEIETTEGTKTVVCGTPFEVKLSGKDIKKMTGVTEKRTDQEDNNICRGTVYFYAKTGCEEDIITMSPADNKSVQGIDQTVRCIELK